MAALRYIVPALAIANGVAAQFGAGAGSSCTNTATATIQSQADATALAACRTFSGSIQVSEDTTENIDLSGLTMITGDLIVNNATQINTVSAGQLSIIGGTFGLTDLTRLSTLQFPSLVRVGSIAWSGLPALSQLNFAQGIQQLSSLDIENTYLSSLQGINLATADSITIVNNNFLQAINMANLGNVTQSLVISNNGAQLDVEFPNLVWTNNGTIRAAQTISLPSLSSVNGSLGFYMGGFSTFTAPNLTAVGGALSFVSNSALNNISLPQLTTIGNALYIVNDSSLATIDGFPALTRIGGNVLGVGTFSKFALPAIKDVTGAFNLTSSGDISSDCTHFKSIAGRSSIIKGTFTCAPTVAAAAGAGLNGTGGATGSATDPTKHSAAAPSFLLPGAATTTVLGLVAVMFALL